MSMKYGFLSFLALCVCLFTLLKSYEVWTHPLGEVSENMAERKSVEKPKTPPAIEVQQNPNSIRSPILIAEKNIFSPERKNFPIMAVEQSRQMIRPQVVLYGVTIAGDYQSASLVNPGRSLRKGERETISLRVGEQISGYKLAMVSPDRIRLERAGDSFEVLLYDSKSPKRRSDSKTENRQALATNPVAAESKEPRVDTPPRFEISNPPDERVASQATPGKPQGSTNEVVGPMPGAITPTPGSSASIPTPTPVTQPTKLTPAQAAQALRERARKGRAMAPMAPMVPGPTN